MSTSSSWRKLVTLSLSEKSSCTGRIGRSSRPESRLTSRALVWSISVLMSTGM
jgi:hypothetical protein